MYVLKYSGVFHPSVLGGTPQIIFHMPMKPQIYESEIKTNRQFWAHGDYSSIVHFWENISAIFEEFFVILDFYFKIHSFIPRFLAEPIMTMYGTW